SYLCPSRGYFIWIITWVIGILSHKPSGVMICMIHVRFLISYFSTWFCIKKHSHLVSEKQWIRSFITSNRILFSGSIYIWQVAKQKHSFPFTVTKISV